MNKQIIILLFILAGNVAQYSQETGKAAFSELLVTANYNQTISNGDLNEFWETGKGISVSALTPFYLGETGLGIDASIIKSKSEIQPNFNSFFINLAWMQDINIFQFSSLKFGVKFGSYIMLFDDNELSEFESNESELAVSASARYGIKIYKNFNLYISTDLITVFTRKRLKFVNAGIGLSYRLNSPQWLKEFLE